MPGGIKNIQRGKDMKELIQMQIKLVPEIIDLSEKRLSILKTIEFNQPIGRRTLANLLKQSERWVRSELDILKNNNLIEINPLGMIVTDEGIELTEKLRDFFIELRDISTLQENIKRYLGVNKVIVVPGDIEQERHVVVDIAKAAFDFMKEKVVDNTVIAVSGGNSVLSVAENAYKLEKKGIVVVPARGGIKSDIEKQSNIVAAKMGKNIGGDYYSLHLPDNISTVLLDEIAKDPYVSKILNYLENTDIFLFGLSSLDTIVNRRSFTNEEIKKMLDMDIRAEAYGCYFDKNGQIVQRSSKVGISPENLDRIKTVMSIGGGASKAEAIILVNKGRRNNVILTDEAAAREIYNRMQGGTVL